MENFTAIYSTEFHKDINYDFQAKDMASAIAFCKQKFNVAVKIVCNNVDKTYYESYSNLLLLKDSLEVVEFQLSEENENKSMAYISKNGDTPIWYIDYVFLELFGYNLSAIAQ